MSNIAILLPNLCGGGAERVNLDLAHEFARFGHRVEFVLMRAEGVFLPEAEASFSVVNLGVKRSFQLTLAFARYLRQSRPEAVIASMWPLTTFAVIARLLSRHDCKLLLVEHCALSIQYRGWGRLHWLVQRLSLGLNCRMADAVAGVSHGVTSDLASLACVSLGRLHVLHNPIPARPFPSEAAIEQARLIWGGHAGARVLTVGSFKNPKNHQLLIRAFAQLSKQTDSYLVLLGEGELRPALLHLSKELGIAERVSFPGFYQDPTPFYQTADLFVLSSDYEGFGNVIVEALACGLPVVSTDCPSGPAEILVSGEYGTLVPVGDKAALASAIQQALVNPYDPERLRRRAMDFAPEIAARRYLELLT